MKLKEELDIYNAKYVIYAGDLIVTGYWRRFFSQEGKAEPKECDTNKFEILNFFTSNGHENNDSILFKRTFAKGVPKGAKFNFSPGNYKLEKVLV